MAAHVSSLARMLSGRIKEEVDSGNRELVTWDLLGGGAVLGSPDLDLNLKVPAGWARRIDLTSGQTYIQKREPEFRSIQDLNLHPPSVQHPRPAAADATISPFPNPCTDLDLKLSVSAPRAVAAVPEYSSICTLEKVKNALERAERVSHTTAAAAAIRPLHPPFSFLPLRPEESLALSPSVSSTTSSSSLKRRFTEAAASAEAAEEAVEGSESSVGAGAEEGEMVVLTCPGCMLYVLVSKVEPRCPKCTAHVPLKPHHQKKKPKLSLDLNSIQTDDDDDD